MKRSIEKRDIYANRVKLRNQIKINRQRERERIEKFQSHDATALSNFSSEECFLRPQISKVCCNKLNMDISVSHPTTETTQESKLPTNEFNRKQKITKRRIPKYHSKKSKQDTSELYSMQERHEREKNLIASMTNLILKT